MLAAAHMPIETAKLDRLKAAVGADGWSDDPARVEPGAEPVRSQPRPEARPAAQAERGQAGWLSELLARATEEEVATMLGVVEKRDLAAALGAAVDRWRNPVFDNAQLRAPQPSQSG